MHDAFVVKSVALLTSFTAQNTVLHLDPLHGFVSAGSLQKSGLPSQLDRYDMACYTHRRWDTFATDIGYRMDIQEFRKHYANITLIHRNCKVSITMLQKALVQTARLQLSL